jgi:hypothetical protein
VKHGFYGLIELFVVFMFVVGWGVLELVVSRQSKRRTREDAVRDGSRR